MKNCSICKKDKDLSFYTKDRSRADGLQASCKSCRAYLDRRPQRITCIACGKTYSVSQKSLRVKETEFCQPCWTRIKNVRGVGSLNNNWKGGLTTEASQFYNSFEWKELRTAIFIRDNYTCQDCGKYGGYLEANHIKARSRCPNLKLVASNIETLCKPCHDKKKWQVYI